VNEYPNQQTQPNRKDATANHNYRQLPPHQRKYVEQTYRAMQKIIARKFRKANLMGQQFDDIANFAIEKVVKDVDVFMRKYPSPLHCANAVATNAFLDSVRRERAQRGHGARGTRTVVGDVPINPSKPDKGSVISNHIGEVVDPEAWIEQEHLCEMLGEVQEVMSHLAFSGFYLTEIEGLTQAQAAKQLKVSLGHLNREMNSARRQLNEMRTRKNWEV